MRPMRALFAVALFAPSVACGGDRGTAPAVEAIPAVVGAFCGNFTPTVTRRGATGATVEVRINRLSYADIRRSDGVIIRQEQRSCLPRTCNFGDVAANTDQQLIELCMSFAG
jgi:hypothetical protein